MIPLLVRGGDVSYMDEGYVIEGFPGDVGRLGDGYFYNTHGVVRQFAAALLLAQQRGNTDIPRILGGSQTPENRVRQLVAAKALRGMRILDLGCGLPPSFAQAAEACGATVYTADMSAIRPDDDRIRDPAARQRRIAKHTVVDLTDPQATAMLAEATGGNLDLVTQGVIQPVHVEQPYLEAETSLSIADSLLRVGGFFFKAVQQDPVAAYRKTS
jgi:hypothetical protein